MTPRELEEYSALRATIRERGTARVLVFMAGLVAWAAIVIATAALAALPVATFLPLLVLGGVFEAVLALHVGVERIGRYLQVFFEDKASDQGWEHRIMQYGQQSPRGGGDPLFAVYFWLAAAVNMVPAALFEPVPVEWGAVVAVHVLFMARVAAARVRAAHQRAVDLEAFAKIKAQP